MRAPLDPGPALPPFSRNIELSESPYGASWYVRKPIRYDRRAHVPPEMCRAPLEHILPPAPGDDEWGPRGFPFPAAPGPTSPFGHPRPSLDQARALLLASPGHLPDIRLLALAIMQTGPCGSWMYLFQLPGLPPSRSPTPPACRAHRENARAPKRCPARRLALPVRVRNARGATYSTSGKPLEVKQCELTSITARREHAAVLRGAQAVVPFRIFSTANGFWIVSTHPLCAHAP